MNDESRPKAAPEDLGGSYSQSTRSALVSVCFEADMRLAQYRDRQDDMDAVRRGRHALSQARACDVVKLIVNRYSPLEVAHSVRLDKGIRVQLVADDAVTVEAWERAMGVVR